MEPEPNQPYGVAPEPAPPPPPPPLEPGYVYPSQVWAYLAIAGTFLCPPFGLVAGIYALTRKPVTYRARMLAITAIIFSAFALLAAVAYVGNEFQWAEAKATQKKTRP